MIEFSKIMVGLDLSKMDDSIISNLKSLVLTFGIKKVYFIHVSKNLILPKEVVASYPDLLAPVDETIKKEIIHEIDEIGMPDTVHFEIIVKEGNPQETILRWCKIKDIDLLVMGRKKKLEGSGSLVKNLSQKYANPILLIPEKFALHTVNKILLPIDFSSYSSLTIAFAQRITKITKAELICCHLYEVPAGYSKTGKSFQEFSEIMLANAKNDFEKFLKENNFPNLQCQFIIKNKKDEAENIMNFCKNNGVEMIIIGSRGRTQSSALLLGSVAEKLVEINNEFPMLIIKKKGESMGFFEALFKI